MMLPLMLLREMILGFIFEGTDESEAMNRRKNADLKKKRSKNDYEKKIFIVMSNNTPEAMTKQQR